MDRPLIIPVMISAALHLGVLFGLRWPHPPHVTTTLPHKPASLVKVVPFSDPPDPVASADSSERAARKTDPVPTSPEPPPPVHVDTFTIPLRPSTPEMDSGKNLIAHFSFPSGNEGPGDGFSTREVLSRDQLDNAPRTRLQIAPVYPVEAKSRGLNGEVLVEFLVDESGAVSAPHVVRSSDRIFDEAAVRAVARWRFEPGRRAGQVVRFCMAVPIAFRLNDD